jgi:hypothetical protein
MGRKLKYKTEEERLEAKRLVRKKYRDNNKDKVNKQIKNWKENNKDRVKEYYIELTEKQKEDKKLYMTEYKEHNKEIFIQYRKDNKVKLNNISKKWAKNNPEKIRTATKKWELNNPEHNKISKNKSRKKRIKNNPLFRLTCNIRSGISKHIKCNGFTKTSRTIEILGCSFEEFKEHIESKWEDWMNWDNYGKYNGQERYGWDIDHITPVSSAINESDIIELNYHTNLQPLCSKINRDIKKGSMDF